MTSRVSIITIINQGEREIESTICSVLGQSYPNLEYIIFDGSNTSIVAPILKKNNAKNTRVITGKVESTYSIMNDLSLNITGEWVNFMNAGNTFYSKQSVEEAFKNNTSNFDIIYGDYIAKYYTKGERIIKASLPQPPHQIQLSLQSVFARTTAVQKILFDAHLEVAADLLFYEICWKQKLKFHYLPLTLSVRTHHSFRQLKTPLAISEAESVLAKFYDIKEIPRLIKSLKLRYHLMYSTGKILPAFYYRAYSN